MFSNVPEAKNNDDRDGTAEDDDDDALAFVVEDGGAVEEESVANACAAMSLNTRLLILVTNISLNIDWYYTNGFWLYLILILILIIISANNSQNNPIK